MSPDVHIADLRVAYGSAPLGTQRRRLLPTDQIVVAEDAGGHTRVGFGGMQLVGLEEGDLVFVRVRELLPVLLSVPATTAAVVVTTGEVSGKTIGELGQDPKPAAYTSSRWNEELH